jgi:hypothetical protein
MIVLLHDFDGLEANYEHDEVDYQVDPYRFGRVEK